MMDIEDVSGSGDGHFDLDSNFVVAEVLETEAIPLETQQMQEPLQQQTRYGSFNSFLLRCIH